jgi:hypothetical protein
MDKKLKKGSFKKLVRNLRKKNHEKIIIQGNINLLPEKQTSSESDISSDKDTNIGSQ